MSSPSAPQAGPIPKLESVSLRNSIGKVSKPLGDITSTSPPNSAGKSKNTPAKRKYHTKSRKGCNTCKRRRVKCDEAKPICKKCDHMGIECSYALVALGKQSPSSSKSSSMEQPSILSPKSSIVSQNQPDSSNNYGSSTSRSPGYSSNNSNVFGQNLNSSITNAALQLLIANATNSITSAPSNNPLATLLSSGKNFVDIPALMGNGSFSGVPNNNTISTSSIQNSSNNINNIIADNGSMSSGNGLSTAELLLLQQLQQLQMQHALLLNLITGNGNSNANINANSSNLTSNNVGNSSNSNPLLSFLSSLTGNSASSAASLLNLANSNELYPGLNTLASQAEQQRKNSNPIIKTESMSSSIKLSNSNNDSILNGDDSMHHLVPPSPHSSNHSSNILSHGDSLTVPEDAKNMISTPSSTSSSIHGTSDNETINTSIPSSPKQSLFTSALPTFNSLDMRLMYHYTTQVWPTITAAGISEEKLWSEYIPKLAFNHPFLMHSVLAFSATHLSRTENGLDECVTTHRGEALRLLRDAVLEISLENTDALVASAIILIMDALANASLPSSPSPKSLPASAWIYHVKGAATILTAVWPLNKTSKFHKFISVDLSDLGDIINSPEKLADNDKTYSELSCFDDSIADLYPVEYSSPYLITLAYLDKLHNERYKSDFILRIFAFPALLDKTFLALLMTGDIAAMRIMRVYYSMLREFTNEMRDKVWFLEGVCKVLPADVDKYSGGGGMHMMLDFLGGGLPSLTTINLSDDFASNMETGFMSN